MDSTNQERRPAFARAHCDVFLGWPAMARDGEVIQIQHFCHHGDTICHPQSGCERPNFTERLRVDATIMRFFQAELCSRFLQSSYDGHVNLAGEKP